MVKLSVVCNINQMIYQTYLEEQQLSLSTTMTAEHVKI
jgi:hypothetical protein